MSEGSIASHETVAESSAQPAPLIVRLVSYLSERFPLLAHGVLILCFVSSNQFLAHALVDPGEPMRYDLSSLLGFLTILCFFLHLRIFDDHKDYLDDCLHYPDRVLQRGIVTLGELKILGAATILVELVLGLVAGPAAFVSVLIVLSFSMLMLKEFFARDWLKQHFLIYVISHMLVVPLLALVVFSFATGRSLWQAPGWYCVYAFVGFFVAFNWEVSRKIRVPADEIDGVDSYTRLCGTYGAAYLVLLIRVVDTGLVVLVGCYLQMSVWFYAWLFILFAICLVGFFQYRFWTTRANAQRMAAYAGFYIVAFDLALAIELVSTYGITLGGNA